MTVAIEPARPLSRLLVAYGRKERRAVDRLLWAFDERLAALARTTTEPMIGQMRIAWWEEALDDAEGIKGRGDPLVDALRATGAMALPGLAAMLDGWEALLTMEEADEAMLLRFARGRGGGLFAALARQEGEDVRAAGSLWALWDLSGHVGDARTRAMAIALAAPLARDARAVAWPSGSRPLRIATALARHDVIRGRAAAPDLTPRLYGRLLRTAPFGI